jgi:hypothetical protein
MNRRKKRELYIDFKSMRTNIKKYKDKIYNLKPREPINFSY